MYVQVDADGRALGFYDRSPPPGAIEITKEIWEQWAFAPNQADYCLRAGVLVLDPKPIDQAELIGHAKQEACRRITAVMPDWRQRNYIARSTELLDKGHGNLTADEQAEAETMRARWDWVKRVRSVSDVIEADIAAGTITGFDGIASDARWPAPLA